MTRQTKTPRQRAEEALRVAQRRHERAVAHVVRLDAETKEAQEELAEAFRLLEYAKQHPALQTPSSTTNQEAGTA